MPLRLTIRATEARPGAGPGGAELVFDRDAVTLGRAATADVRLPGASVSLLHARLERVGADWFVLDDGSTNGTRLNGTRLRAGQRRLLRAGDLLEVPGFVLAVAMPDGGPVSGPEATHEVARRMVREVVQALGGADSAPLLRVAGGPQAGEELLLADLGRAYVVGRAAGCALRLDDRDVSREHATVRRDYGGVTLLDEGAKNGVLVDGRRVNGPHQLADGEEIVVGATRIRFVDPAEAYLRELEARPDVAVPPAPVPSASETEPPASAPTPEAAPQGGPAAEPAASAPASAAARGSRSALLLIVFAVVVALGAAAALLLLLRS